jgi:acyl-coenzyme A synthetase/AMP-(fatty) acid ligase
MTSSGFPAPTALPLLAGRDLAAPLAWRRGVPVSAATFLSQAQALAQTLPAAGRPINLCQDRYRFALGLAAALLRGHTSLMPPNALPETLRALQADGDPAPAYAMVDDAALDVGGLQRVFIEPAEDAAPATEVPLIAADLEAVRLLTSGSTGAPQPHGKRWGALVLNIGAEAERLAALCGRSTLVGFTLLGTVPAQHSYGFESTVLLALLGGACFDAGRPFYPADIAAALATVPTPRALVTTPFHLKTLLLAGVALPPVDLLLSATAPLSPQLAQQAEAATGGTLVEIYGCTEAGQVATRRTTAGETWHTLGALRVWREDRAATEGGEAFLVQGGHVGAPTPLADVLEIESPTHFGLLGRANDLIHVAGKRSSLAHLNFHLNRIAGVEDGVFWMPEEQADGIARPVAFVVAPTLSARQLIEALREHLEPAFVPRRVLHVPALPREATGKLTAAVLARFAKDALAEGGRYWVGADHPAFPGHFPGQPVLPGVAVLAFVMRALEEQPALRERAGTVPQINNVKFISPVMPETALQVLLQPQGSGVGFEVRRAGETGSVVAKGLLTAGTPA